MEQLRASAAQVELLPRIGNLLSGFAARSLPAQGHHDPLCANAVLLSAGDTTLLVVSCDLIGFTSAQAWELRCRISSRTGVPAQNIMICCTHTHSGPASVPYRGLMGQVDIDWFNEALERIVGVASSLPNSLAPAKITYNSSKVAGIGYNRDDNSHHIDDELLVVGIDGVDGNPIATLINYATHAVTLGPSNLLFSGDYPGAVTRMMNSQRGGISLFIQGACGDVDPVVYRDRGWGTGTFNDCEDIAGKLVENAIRLLADAPASPNAHLETAVSAVTLPMDPPVLLDELLELITLWEEDTCSAESSIPVSVGSADIFLKWAGELRDAISKGTVPAETIVSISAARINDLRIVAAPFETYCDIALEIKSALGPGKTIFAGYTNGLYGYLPSKWAKERGGYGSDTSCRIYWGMLTAYASRADDAMISAAVKLGKSLK